MTISYINFSAMSGHSSMIHMLNSVRSTNKDRQARKDHESNRLDRAMQCRKRKISQERRPYHRVGEVQSSFATQFTELLSPRVRSHAPLLVIILVFSPRRLMEVLAGASSALGAAVRVAARLATTDANVRHLDGRGGTVDWREVGGRLRWVVGG